MNLSRLLVSTIQRAVADYYSLTVFDLLCYKRTKHYVEPRQVAMWLTRELTHMSYPAIAREFNREDHTTVMHAVNKINAGLAEDMGSKLADRCAYLKNQLTGSAKP